MKRPVTVVASAAVVGAIAISSASTAPRATATPQATPRLAGPPPTIVQYGYVRSLVRAGSRYRLRFDPALFLSGETANRAAVEDGAIPPGDIVPNDYYVRNETKKQLTYAVLPGARVTVVTNSGAFTEAFWHESGAVRLVPRPDPHLIGEAVVTLLGSPSMQQALAARAVDLYDGCFARRHAADLLNAAASQRSNVA